VEEKFQPLGDVCFYRLIIIKEDCYDLVGLKENCSDQRIFKFLPIFYKKIIFHRKYEQLQEQIDNEELLKIILPRCDCFSF